jgi:hypothetical protein
MFRIHVFLTALVCLGITGVGQALGQQENVFQSDIRSLFAQRCIGCHGPDRAEGGLRLDLQSSSFAELESGERAIVPHDADQSELMRRIQSDDETIQMPPEGARLTTEEIHRLRKWITAGGKFSNHWAFEPVKNPPMPVVANSAWVSNSIDQFVLAKLERKKVRPSAEAHRSILIKRLYYDLLGLPPTPDEVESFVADQSADAYEKLVDQLLRSQHFGERWGRHWLDKARYADSDGYEKDRPRPNAWRYRDWVINAVNQDQPFDQFSIYQLAGDLFTDATRSQKLATAFHRQTLTNTEGGTDREQFRVEATFDRTETSASIWLGLTLTCARCHTHKYDQISHREYYQLYAFFNDSNESNATVDVKATANQEFLRKSDLHRKEIEEVNLKIKDQKKKLQGDIQRWTAEMIVQAAKESRIRFHPADCVDVKSSSGVDFDQKKDGSYLAKGRVADKDKLTLVLKSPSSPLTGIRIEVLTDSTLPGNGPGRAPNGNFVLSEMRAYLGSDPNFKKDVIPLRFSSAEADWSQDKFPPSGALSKQNRTGWAISPQMGQPHHLDLFTATAVKCSNDQYLQVVLDQQYGGEHTIGRFRILTMTGIDPLRTLPDQVSSSIRQDPSTRSVQQNEVIADYFLSQHSTTASLMKRRNHLRDNAPTVAEMSVRVMNPTQRTTKILHRGDFLQPEKEVQPGVLNVLANANTLGIPNQDHRPSRMDLAKWLFSPQHPLTARVTVNQIWSHLFGRGIVATVNDFGVRGDFPSHPQLLDWLAWEFSRNMSWSRKKLIKCIVMSATYRQSSVHRADVVKIDPTNRWFWRQNRWRVSAEIVRDLHLAASGLMSKKIGGPSVFPPLPTGVEKLSYANNFKWKTSPGEDRYRRGMYTFFKRTSPHPNLVSFDCPDSNTSVLRRETSNTPLQALVTLNNDVYLEASQAMVKRIYRWNLASDRDRLKMAMRICLTRQPDNGEVGRFLKLLADARSYYQQNEADAEKMTARHPVDDLSSTENAAWIATLRMVMNLDEFIVRD